MEDDIACSYEQNLHYGIGYVKYNIAYNEIMSMMAMGDEAAIEERMDRQKSQRRKSKAFWKRHRETDWDKVRAARDAEIVSTDITTNDD